jgi:hypothetical protein
MLFACLVLVGPIVTDRFYYAGETIVLEERDATILAFYGLLEILGEVTPQFVSQIPG